MISTARCEQDFLVSVVKNWQDRKHTSTDMYCYKNYFENTSLSKEAQQPHQELPKRERVVRPVVIVVVVVVRRPSSCC